MIFPIVLTAQFVAPLGLFGLGAPSGSARLVPWTTLPSMQRRSPSGLMISPQSCATVNLRAHTLPVRRSISTSVTIATNALERRGDLVDKGFAGELDLRADRIAQMGGAQWRGAVEQRGDRLPGEPLVRETVGFGGHAKAL